MTLAFSISNDASLIGELISTRYVLTTNSDPASNYYVYKIIGVRINDEVVIKSGTVFLIE